jgi:hypothetical protein
VDIAACRSLRKSPLSPLDERRRGLVHSWTSPAFSISNKTLTLL